MGVTDPGARDTIPSLGACELGRVASPRIILKYLMMFSNDHHHPHHNIFLRHLGASQMLWLSSSPPMQSSSPSHFHLFGIHLEKKHLEKNTPRKNTPENHHICYKLSWLWLITNTTKIVTTSDLQHDNPKRKWSSSKKWSPSSTKIYHPQKNDEHHKKDHPDLWSLHSNSLTPHSSGLPPKKMWKWNWERTKLFGTKCTMAKFQWEL